MILASSTRRTKDEGLPSESHHDRDEGGELQEGHI